MSAITADAGSYVISADSRKCHACIQQALYFSADEDAADSSRIIIATSDVALGGGFPAPEVLRGCLSRTIRY